MPHPSSGKGRGSSEVAQLVRCGNGLEAETSIFTSFEGSVGPSPQCSTVLPSGRF